MAGEDQYIHPVIQAIMGAVQARQNQQQLAATIAQRQQENQQAAQRIKQEEERIANEHEYQKGMLEHQNNLYQSTLDAAKLNALKFIREAGGNPADISNTGGPGVQTPSNLPGVVGGLPIVPDTRGLFLKSLGITLPTSNLPTEAQQQETLGDILAHQAGKKAGAEAEAQAPFIEAQKNRDFNRELQLNTQNHTFASQQLIQQGANQERIANINGNYRLSAEREATAGRIEGIKIAHQLGLNDVDSQIANNLEDSVINGTAPYSSLTNDQKRAVEGIAAAKGHVIPKTKDYVTAIEGAKSAQELIQQARDLANNYSSDSQGGAGGVIGGALNSVKAQIPMTDVAAQIAAFKGKVNVAAKSLGINRTSNAEMDRLFNSVFSPARTKQQNLNNVEQLAHALNTEVESKFPSNIPATQRNYVLGNRGITEFGGYSDKSTGKTKTAIQMDDGRILPDTPENRKLVGLQ